MTEDKNPRDKDAAAIPPAYETPAIEEVITPEEMEREVHYAGDGTINIG
jgi:hypothetical protein